MVATVKEVAIIVRAVLFFILLKHPLYGNILKDGDNCCLEISYEAGRDRRYKSIVMIYGGEVCLNDCGIIATLVEIDCKKDPLKHRDLP